MTRDQVSSRMVALFETEIMPTRENGQKEYSGGEDNAFGNFQRLAKELSLDQKQVLWVYAMKHKDGIASYLNGHTSQREDVTGRLKDLIVYLFLLWCMIEEERDLEREMAKRSLFGAQQMVNAYPGPLSALGGLGQVFARPW